jgi:hypothetical protein
VHITCHCGQAFEISDALFPRRVSCHVCGWHFTILDTGELIDLSDDLAPAADSHAALAAAIQARPASVSPLPDWSAVCTSETIPHLPMSSPRPFEPSIEHQVRLHDLQWNQERLGFAMINLAGFIVFPSRTLALGLCVAWLVVYGCGIGLLMSIDVPWPHALWQAGIVVAFGCLITAGPILSVAGKFEEAESEWQQKRIQIIVKNSGMST